jgi:retinol-binding protein 3
MLLLTALESCLSRMFAAWLVFLFVFVPLLAEPAVSNSQSGVAQDADKRVVVEAVAKTIEDNYVCPDIARRMARALRGRSSAHEYDRIADDEVFAEQLTRDLFETGHDRHIKVFQPGSRDARNYMLVSVTKEQELRNEAWVNHGFSEVKRLAGNVGYLKVDRLLPTGTAADTANAAMKFLSDVEALIIDLRDNRGGSPEMIQLLCTYLFESGTRVHLNDFQRRGQVKLVESYTLASVPDTRFAGTPVFILTSHHTFSGAEELAYDLQSLQRATIVGEATGGGANPGRVFQLPQDFLVFVPTGRAINPVTKTNWEGVGVKPDIEVPSAVAVDMAHLAALRAIGHFPHLEPDQEQEVRESIKSLEKRIVPPS